MAHIAIVGAGVVGTALGVALGRAGHRVVAVASRSEESARRAAERIGEAAVFADPAAAARAADTVLVTVPDRAIEAVAAAIAAAGPLPAGWLGLHTSGYHASDALAALREAGGATGSVHPLQSFADVDQALARIPGTRFFHEGDEPERVRALVEAIGGVPVELDADRKPLYHAAAATASNLLVTVVDLALAMGECAGLDREDLLPALLPLVSGSVRNLETLGLPRALTGPIARGDAATLAGHLEALRRDAPGLLEPYAALARRTVDLADRRGGIDEESRRAMLELLKNVDAPPGSC